MAKAKQKEKASKSKKSKGKKNIIKGLNFSGVKTFKTLPEGSYVVKVLDAVHTESSNDNPMIKWDFEVAEGKYAGSKLWTQTMLTEDSLWKTREALEALGVEVPDDEDFDLDLDELKDQQCGVTVYHDMYEGKPRPKISDFMAEDEVKGSDDEDDSDEDEEEEDEKPAKGKKAKKADKKSSKKSKSDEPNFDEMDEDELNEFIEENGLDVDLSDYKKLAKQQAAVKEAYESAGEESDDEDEDESEEDESDDEETYTKDQIEDMDLEELQTLNDDLALKIKGMKKMKVKEARKEVLAVLKKKKLLTK